MIGLFNFKADVCSFGCRSNYVDGPPGTVFHHRFQSLSLPSVKFAQFENTFSVCRVQFILKVSELFLIFISLRWLDQVKVPIVMPERLTRSSWKGTGPESITTAIEGSLRVPLTTHLGDNVGKYQLRSNSNKKKWDMLIENKSKRKKIRLTPTLFHTHNLSRD